MLTAALVAFASTSVAEGITFGEHVTLTGFGTLGVTRTNTDAAQYRPDLRHDSGADRSVDAGVDSKLGLQANVKINDTFSAVAQVLSARRMSHATGVEWLYGQAKLPAGFTVKLGRMVMPTFMVSDSRSVGYAAHWVRAPAEVYLLYPSTSFDGGQLTWRGPVGPVNVTTQLSAGTAKADFSLAGLDLVSDHKKLRSLNVLVDYGNWLLRYGTTSTQTTVVGLPLPTFKETFSGIGLQYDNGTALVMGEYTTRRVKDTGVADSDSWYVSGGWRFGQWMPYATIANFKPKGPIFMETRNDTTRAIGVRWDAMPGVAVKLQAQNSRAGILGFVNAQPSFLQAHPTVRVYSATVDFVF